MIFMNFIIFNYKIVAIILILCLSNNTWSACNDDAIDFVYQFYDVHSQGGSINRQKALLRRALQLCPTMPEAHNNLASLLEDEASYSQAISHYKQAIQLRSNFPQAWYGLGETYYKQGRFALSLEAHLHACQDDSDSKNRILALLEDKSYSVTESGKIIDKDSLLALYDSQRRQAMNQMLSDCGLRGVGRITPDHTFRNFHFAIGKAELQPGSEEQLNELALAFTSLSGKTIKIHGHTDTQPFKGVAKWQSDVLNLKLSQDRAATIAQALAARGVVNIETYGYGYRKPLVRGNYPAAWAKNRRVEIQVW
jgi:outer membrane protein OmpA-like peptidoglycan-associated protein